MTALKKVKENLFLVIVALAYIAMFIINPVMGTESIKNSGYYIKEMLFIMPVIFVLTALLDMWIPKEKIMRYLGKDAGFKGVFLSFVVGSVSAGPIYAAFPMCLMLRKKGASIRNIIIILSSWAVIKVPMLLNEAKFLGPKFMAIRWVLTVLAILIFSWISAKIIKDEDLPVESPAKAGLHINRDACMGCTICAKAYPELFEMQGKKSVVKAYDKQNLNLENLQRVIGDCPVHAIEYSEE
ncbi:MAG: permease [Clostridiales bacterium]|nr:permease [Clostridiales bacterium]